MTALELLTALRVEVTADGEILLDKLQKELGLEYLPEKTFQAAQEIFGGSIYNPASRTFQSLSRRVQHALRVWAEKYGPLSEEQADYADRVLQSCLMKAKVDAKGDRSKLFAFAQASIGRAVNHEVVHGGFQKRSATVDVGDPLAGVA